MSNKAICIIIPCIVWNLILLAYLNHYFSSKTIDYPNNAHTNVNSEFSKQTEAAKHFEDIDNCKAGSNEEITSKSEKTDTSDQASLETNAVESVNQNLNAVSSDLPEGFFDDPVQDAKVRYHI